MPRVNPSVRGSNEPKSSDQIHSASSVRFSGVGLNEFSPSSSSEDYGTHFSTSPGVTRRSSYGRVPDPFQPNRVSSAGSSISQSMEQRGYEYFHNTDEAPKSFGSGRSPSAIPIHLNPQKLSGSSTGNSRRLSLPIVVSGFALPVVDPESSDDEPILYHGVRLECEEWERAPAVVPVEYPRRSIFARRGSNASSSRSGSSKYFDVIGSGAVMSSGVFSVFSNGEDGPRSREGDSRSEMPEHNGESITAVLDRGDEVEPKSIVADRVFGMKREEGFSMNCFRISRDSALFRYVRWLAISIQSYNFLFIPIFVAWTCSFVDVRIFHAHLVMDVVLLIYVILECFEERPDEWGLGGRSLAELVRDKIVKANGLIELLSTLPVDFFLLRYALLVEKECHAIQAMDLIRIGAVTRVTRAFSMGGLVRAFLSSSTIYVPHQVSRLIKSTFGIIMIVHISACLFWFISSLETTADSWVYRHFYGDVWKAHDVCARASVETGNAHHVDRGSLKYETLVSSLAMDWFQVSVDLDALPERDTNSSMSIRHAAKILKEKNSTCGDVNLKALGARPTAFGGRLIPLPNNAWEMIQRWRNWKRSWRVDPGKAAGLVNRAEDTGDTEYLFDLDFPRELGTQYIVSFVAAQRALLFLPRDVITTTELLYTVIETLCVAVFYGVLFANLYSVVKLLGEQEREAEKEHLLVFERRLRFLQDKSFPADIQEKIWEQTRWEFNRTQGVSEDKIFSGLPKALQQDIRDFLYMDLLVKVPLFMDLPRDVLRMVTRGLMGVSVRSGQAVFSAGDEANELYLIRGGAVDIVSVEGKHLRTLESGSFFGEIALLDDKPRSATVIARVDSDLCCLTKSTFGAITAQSPELLARVDAEAAKRRNPLPEKSEDRRRSAKSVFIRSVQKLANVAATSIRSLSVASRHPSVWGRASVTDRASLYSRLSVVGKTPASDMRSSPGKSSSIFYTGMSDFSFPKSSSFSRSPSMSGRFVDQRNQQDHAPPSHVLHGGVSNANEQRRVEAVTSEGWSTLKRLFHSGALGPGGRPIVVSNGDGERGEGSPSTGSDMSKNGVSEWGSEDEDPVPSEHIPSRSLPRPTSSRLPGFDKGARRSSAPATGIAATGDVYRQAKRPRNEELVVGHDPGRHLRKRSAGRSPLSSHPLNVANGSSESEINVPSTITDND
ncbi:hypothetical protein BJ742DRAFT_883035 [Cladochytrium replicatum]|nr:hypothetical protein BJ742DRAFT_883035 [Cladochytrium replicatum]